MEVRVLFRALSVEGKGVRESVRTPFFVSRNPAVKLSRTCSPAWLGVSSSGLRLRQDAAPSWLAANGDRGDVQNPDLTRAWTILFASGAISLSGPSLMSCPKRRRASVLRSSLWRQRPQLKRITSRKFASGNRRGRFQRHRRCGRGPLSGCRRSGVRRSGTRCRI